VRKGKTKKGSYAGPGAVGRALSGSPFADV